MNPGVVVLIGGCAFAWFAISSWALIDYTRRLIAEAKARKLARQRKDRAELIDAFIGLIREAAAKRSR